MATVALLATPARQDAGHLAATAAAWLQGHGHRARTFFIGEPDQVTEDGHTGPLSSLDLSGVDLAVSLGGDGTFLRIIPLAYAAQVPILGVNFGRLGYLLEVEPGELEAALASALSGEAVLEDRSALAIEVSGELNLARGGDHSVVGRDSAEKGGRWWLALNELVVEKTLAGHTVRLGTAIGGEPFLTYVADGVLIASPTGSTAYNLSAGGPVLSPRLQAMVVTAVAPHLGFDRSIVLDGEQKVAIEVREGRPAILVVDGREVGRLSPGAIVTCRLAPHPVRFVAFGRLGFGGRLRATLARERDR